jgi:hypothetical protein
MDEQPSKRRQLSKTTVSDKDDMVEELNKTLPHDRHKPKRGLGFHHVQPAPLTEESQEPAPIPAPSAPPSVKLVPTVKKQPSKGPSFDGPSNYGSRGVYPRGMIMGSATVDDSPRAIIHRWSTMRRLSLGSSGSIRASVRPRGCLHTGDLTSIPSPALEGVAFVHPLTTVRERARRSRPLIVLRRSWSA